jgi:hypothetical protein
MKHKITAQKKTAGDYETLLDEITYKIVRKLDPGANPEEVAKLREGINRAISEVFPQQ